MDERSELYFFIKLWTKSSSHIFYRAHINERSKLNFGQAQMDERSERYFYQTLMDERSELYFLSSSDGRKVRATFLIKLRMKSRPPPQHAKPMDRLAKNPPRHAKLMLVVRLAKNPPRYAKLMVRLASNRPQLAKLMVMLARNRPQIAKLMVKLAKNPPCHAKLMVRLARRSTPDCQAQPHVGGNLTLRYAELSLRLAKVQPGDWSTSIELHSLIPS
ncbi:hypothetical protein ACE6H2_002735 [Prunus campanulata]